MPVLEFEDLALSYRGGVRALDGVRFTVPDTTIVGLVGESGCGKTTALRAATAVLPEGATIARGRILFEGRSIYDMPAAERRALLWRQIAFVPQSAMSAFDPVYRLRDQFREVLCERGGRTRAAADAQSAALFERVGLMPERLAAYPHQLSGGMRQRAAIALALALSPRLVLADEPVTALDVIVQRQVLDVMRDLQRRLGLSMLVVTHDIGVVAYLTGHVVVMYAGQVVESGPTAAVLSAPRHPYTLGLRAAFPDLDDDAPMQAIDGAPPDLAAPPPGCRFAPRCPFAQARCLQDAPALAPVGKGHLAACWRAGEGLAWGR
jgi:peptide/nickel transport system ATP-binding protein